MPYTEIPAKSVTGIIMETNTQLAEIVQEEQAVSDTGNVVSLSRRSLVNKRMFDFFATSLLIVLIAPFWFFLALLIKLTSLGPAVFHQKRVGRRKHVFSMYKFRSMIENADEMRPQLRDLNEVKGSFFKIKNDPRITGVGRWMRRYSLDETPQLINVLKGEMSLVGPRPMPLDEVEGYTDWHHQRHQVKPGLTGLWQVSGRSDLSFEEMIELDLFYIQNCSFRLDLKILLETISVVLRGKGAY